MEIVIGKTAGFCAGVNYAVKTAEENIKNEKIYCLGEIVHNGQVIKKLENKGMITVDNIEDIPNGSKVIFRAHGEPERIYKRAEEKELKIIDLTCGRVKLIHDKVQKEKNNAFIIIVGKAKHPEVIGIKGFSGENSYIIENEDDILDAYMEYEKTNIGRIFVVSQTTFSSEKFDRLIKEIKTNFIEADIIVDKTICNATEKRQKETRELAKNFHTMIIIGGKNSSNTKELVNVAKEECENVYSIETADELKNIDFSEINKIGIMAGASTPKESILEIENYLRRV